MSNIKIVRLHKKNKSYLTILPLTTTVSELLENLDVNTKYYIEVDYLNTKPYVNLSLLLLETELGKLNTLQEIEDALTPILVIAYTDNIITPSDDQKSLKAIQLLHTSDFNISYVNKDVPEERDKPLFIYRLPDLVITKTNIYNTTNLEKCLLSVNGLVSLPHMYNGELYSPLSMKFMNSNTESNHPDIMLLDFEELGDVSFLPLKDCVLKYKNVDQVPNKNSDIEVILPDTYDISNKTVFVVLGHTLFLRYKPSVVSGRTLLISPNQVDMQTTLLKYTNTVEDFKTSFGYCETSDITEYLQTLQNDDNYGAFLVIVDNKQIIITEESVEHYPIDTYTSVVTNTILFDGINSSFKSHVNVDYDSTDDLYALGPDSYFNLNYTTQETPKSVKVNLLYSSYADISSSSERSYKLVKMVGV